MPTLDEEIRMMVLKSISDHCNQCYRELSWENIYDWYVLRIMTRSEVMVCKRCLPAHKQRFDDRKSLSDPE